MAGNCDGNCPRGQQGKQEEREGSCVYKFSVNPPLSVRTSHKTSFTASLPFAFSTAAMKFSTSLVFLATASLSAAASIPSKSPLLSFLIITDMQFSNPFAVLDGTLPDDASVLEARKDDPNICQDGKVKDPYAHGCHKVHNNTNKGWEASPGWRGGGDGHEFAWIKCQKEEHQGNKLEANGYLMEGDLHVNHDAWCWLTRDGETRVNKEYAPDMELDLGKDLAKSEYSCLTWSADIPGHGPRAHHGGCFIA